MLVRLGVILGILAIPLGIFVIISTQVPALGAIIARPFCSGEIRAELLSCFNGDTATTFDDLYLWLGIVMIVGGSILIAVSLFGSLIALSRKLDRILAHGEAAEATILEMRSTGTTINNQPLMKFRLRVQPAYGQSYEAKTMRILPYLFFGNLNPGATVPVKYDPQKPEDVALDLGAFSVATAEKAKHIPSVGDSLTVKLQELEEAFRLELITKEEYEESRQRILKGL